MFKITNISKITQLKNSFIGIIYQKLLIFFLEFKTVLTNEEIKILIIKF